MARLAADSMRLRVETALPSALTELPATALADALGGPTLFDLRRAGEPPLFVSVLVHGNETSGWDAVRRLRAEFAASSALLFVGNVAAARASARALPGRPDFNRVWDGGESPEAQVADAVAEYVEPAMPRLAVDVHNNTGRNPPYSVVARQDAATLATARAFAERALLATQPTGFQTGRFARFCTAVTVEVGTPDDPSSTDRAAAFLRCQLAPSPPRRPAADDAPLAVFETVARVTLSDDAVLVPDTQRFNFRTAPAGAMLVKRGTLTAHAADGADLGEVYFRNSNGATLLKRPSVVAMYTGSLQAARQDCLCYFLEAAALADPLAGSRTRAELYGPKRGSVDAKLSGANG